MLTGYQPGITGYHWVSPGITGDHRVSLNPVFQPVACGAPIPRSGGGPHLAAPPGPRLAIAFFCCFYAILPVYGNGWQVVLPFMETVGKQFLEDQSSRLWKRLASSPPVYGNGWQAVLRKVALRLWKRLTR